MTYEDYLYEKQNIGKDLSFWIDSTLQTNYDALQEDINVDVAIVGGGMVGILSAYLLKKEGLKVAVIEANHILQGTTGHTTAKITSQHNLIYDKIKNKMGEEKASQYAQANEQAISFIHQIIKEKNIQCDFSWQPAYVYTQSDKYIQKIQDEVQTASALGINAFYEENIPLPFEVKAAIRFDNQAQFHPRKFLLRIAEEVNKNGSYIFEKTKAMNIEEKDPCVVIVENGKKIKAKNIIIASHFPFYDGLGFYFARMYTERSYVLGVRIQGEFPKGMYINAESPARSFRSQDFEGQQLVLVGGENHKTGHEKDTLKRYYNLKDATKKSFEVKDILYRWSTQDCMTLDHVPYVGNLTSNISNIFVATGFGKWGMTNSTASAMILRDLIIKGKSPWEDVYNPSRFTPSSTFNFIAQNVDVAVNFISDKITSAPETMNIAIGEGKVIDVDGKRTGAYKDEDGNLHLVDTTCTHLGCELHWNNAEKSWDCPCHGSRFSFTGEVIEGPALKALDKRTKQIQ